MRTIVACLALLAAAPANAAWEYVSSDSKLSETPTTTAGVYSGESAFSLQCAGGIRFAMFITEEIASDSVFDALKDIDVEGLLRADDGAVLHQQARAIDHAGRVALVFRASDALLDQIFAAKDQLTVAASIHGRLAHETAFDLVGAHDAVRQLRDSCRTE